MSIIELWYIILYLEIYFNSSVCLYLVLVQFYYKILAGFSLVVKHVKRLDAILRVHKYGSTK